MPLPKNAHAPATGVARFDLYGQVHKGLRAFMGATLDELGRLDSADDQEVKRVLDQLDQLLDFCVGHLDKENSYVHTAMQSRSRQSAQQVAGEHEEHLLAIERLRAGARDLACTTGADREQAAAALYRLCAVFVAHNLEHMELEESQHNEVLWAHFSDDELAGIFSEIFAATTPSDVALSARWMVPALTPGERTALVGGLRAQLPADSFNALVGLIRPHLPQREWHRLAALFGLADAPAPGNLQLVRTFLEAVFLRYDAAEAQLLVTEDFVSHPWAAMGVPPGPAGVSWAVDAFRTAFDQIGLDIQDTLVEGDRVVVRYRYAGRHCGSLFGIAATGRSFDMAGILIARVQGGKVAEYWREEDMLGLQQQLGLASLLPA